MSEAPAEPTIAYVLKMFPRLSETFVLDELLELERQGVRLHVYSLKRPNDGLVHADAERLRAPVTYVPRMRDAPLRAAVAHARVLAGGPARYLGALARVARRPNRAAFKHFSQAAFIAASMRSVPADHVHAHFASTAASVALHLHRLTGVSFSFTAHAKDIYRDTVRPRDLGRKLAAARFAVTVSDYNRRYLAGVRGSERIVRIYNGLELARFSPNGTGRDGPPPLILAVGRLIEKKGFDDLIAACGILRDEGRAFRCRIVGAGELEARLRARVRELRLGGLVELAGPMAREQLLELYPRATVVAAPGLVGSDGNRDGLPTVLIEAMALGIPVVAADVTGIPELVRDGETGVLVPQRDPRALAAAIANVIDDEPAARRRSRAARQLVERQFDLRTNVESLRRLLEASATS